MTHLEVNCGGEAEHLVKIKTSFSFFGNQLLKTKIFVQFCLQLEANICICIVHVFLSTSSSFHIYSPILLEGVLPFILP